MKRNLLMSTAALFALALMAGCGCCRKPKCETYVCGDAACPEDSERCYTQKVEKVVKIQRGPLEAACYDSCGNLIK